MTNSHQSIRKNIISLVVVWITFWSYGQQLPNKISETEFSIGKSIKIQSEILNESRTLNIYLPLSYTSDTAKTYPVIYLLDGSKDEDFIHVSGIVQFGSFSWINMLPESIVLGIANVDRKRDFTYPTQNEKDKKEFPTTGKSEHFIKFIEKELQPFVGANFRTNQTETIIGQSLGGLLATEILMKKPELFDNYIIVSPSLWWDDESLLNYTPKETVTEKSIFVAVGKEGKIMEQAAEKLYKKLSHLKENNAKLHFKFLEDKDHGDANSSLTALEVD